MPSNIGTEVYISSALPATDDQAGYEALTWTEVGGVLTFGEVGSTTSEVSYDLLKSGLTITEKGPTQYGKPVLTYVKRPGDTGQAAVVAAAEASNNADVALKVVRPDGEIEYFQANVMGDKYSEANPTSARSKTHNVAINSKPVVV